MGMKCQPNRNYNSNDAVQTPPDLAKRIVEHFQPSGKILEPCRGMGNFLEFLPGADWCEISKGRDFFDYKTPVDWIVTNPPWSQIRPFLQHAMTIANDIVFLMTVNHVWTKARIRDIHTSGYHIKEICLVEMPKEFPQSGFQLGAIHISKGPMTNIIFNDISKDRPEFPDRVGRWHVKYRECVQSCNPTINQIGIWKVQEKEFDVYELTPCGGILCFWGSDLGVDLTGPSQVWETDEWLGHIPVSLLGLDEAVYTYLGD